MGIFSRLGQLIKSNINDLITKAEDPEKMLNQVLLEMQQQLVDAKKSVAVAIAAGVGRPRYPAVHDPVQRSWHSPKRIFTNAPCPDVAEMLPASIT